LSEKYYKKYELPSNYLIPTDVLPERYGRALAMQLACNAGNDLCLRNSFTLVHLFADHGWKIPAGLEEITICSGLRGAGANKEDEYVNVWREMSISSDAIYKSALINALGCTDNPKLLKDYLESSLGSAASQVNYTTAERRAVFTSVITNSYSSLPVVIDFLNKFELDIISRYGWTLQTILTNIANTIKDKNDQFIFTEYLLTLDHLSSTSLNSILKIMTNNFNTQNLFRNSRQLQLMNAVVNEWQFGVSDGNTWRLPRATVPEHYRVHFDVRNVQSGDRDYTGEVSIDILMLEYTNRIMFHSKNQVINELKVFERGTTKELQVSSYRLFPATDILLIILESPLGGGQKITVNIKYATSLLTTSYGFYQTSYDMYGKTRYVAATQFEPTRARYAFPCYDGKI
jgi:hypothetical protein